MRKQIPMDVLGKNVDRVIRANERRSTRTRTPRSAGRPSVGPILETMKLNPIALASGAAGSPKVPVVTVAVDQSTGAIVGYEVGLGGIPDTRALTSPMSKSAVERLFRCMKRRVYAAQPRSAKSVSSDSPSRTREYVLQELNTLLTASLANARLEEQALEQQREARRGGYELRPLRITFKQPV